MKRKRAALDCSTTCLAPKRCRCAAAQPPLPSPPGTDSSHGPHTVHENPAVDFSPVSRPDIILDTYDPDFGAKVYAAWENKKEMRIRARARRICRYGAEIAVLYSPGTTPESVRNAFEKAQQEELRNWQEELTSDDEDEHESVAPSADDGPPALLGRNEEPPQAPQDPAILRKRRRYSFSILSSLNVMLGQPARARRRSAPPKMKEQPVPPKIESWRGRGMADTSALQLSECSEGNRNDLNRTVNYAAAPI